MTFLTRDDAPRRRSATLAALLLSLALPLASPAAIVGVLWGETERETTTKDNGEWLTSELFSRELTSRARWRHRRVAGGSDQHHARVMAGQAMRPPVGHRLCCGNLAPLRC